MSPCVSLSLWLYLFFFRLYFYVCFFLPFSVHLDSTRHDQIHTDTNLKQTEAQNGRSESTHKGVNQLSKYVTSTTTN